MAEWLFRELHMRKRLLQYLIHKLSGMPLPLQLQVQGRLGDYFIDEVSSSPLLRFNLNLVYDLEDDLPADKGLDLLFLRVRALFNHNVLSLIFFAIIAVVAAVRIVGRCSLHEVADAELKQVFTHFLKVQDVCKFWLILVAATGSLLLAGYVLNFLESLLHEQFNDVLLGDWVSQQPLLFRQIH
jgi:hypothetical protein